MLEVSIVLDKVLIKIRRTSLESEEKNKEIEHNLFKKTNQKIRKRSLKKKGK
jgi:hypothetical protein